MILVKNFTVYIVVLPVVYNNDTAFKFSLSFAFQKSLHLGEFHIVLFHEGKSSQLYLIWEYLKVSRETSWLVNHTSKWICTVKASSFLQKLKKEKKAAKNDIIYRSLESLLNWKKCLFNKLFWDNSIFTCKWPLPHNICKN